MLCEQNFCVRNFRILEVVYILLVNPVNWCLFPLHGNVLLSVTELLGKLHFRAIIVTKAVETALLSETLSAHACLIKMIIQKMQRQLQNITESVFIDFLTVGRGWQIFEPLYCFLSL